MKREEYTIMFRVEDRHWWYIGLRAMLQLVWERHAPRRAIRLLDVGCGTGANLSFFESNTACYGIDFSIDAVRYCRKRGLHATATASALDLPFADNSFDVVVSCDVLCHQSIKDKLQPLREIHRVLRPEGIAILNLPAYQWLYSSHDVHVQTDRRFSAREITGLLRQSSMECIDSTYWNTLLFPIILPTRLWRKLRPLAGSDLDNASGERFSSVFRAVLAMERAILRAVSMPAGLSLLCVAKKNGESTANI